MGNAIQGAQEAITTGGASLIPGVKEGVSGAWGDITGRNAAEAAQRAADLQAGATGMAVGESRRQFDIGQANLAPWMRAGRQGLDEYMTLMGLGGDTAGAMRALQSSPGYQFQKMLGQRQMEAGSAARGGLGSGKALTAANQFGQDYASTAYGNRLASLANLSGQGQASAAGSAQMGMQQAQNLGNLWTSGANAQGAALMAGQQARQSGLLGMLNLGARAYGAS